MGGRLELHQSGEASASQFRDALEKNYVTVVKLNGKPSKVESDARH